MKNIDLLIDDSIADIYLTIPEPAKEKLHELVSFWIYKSQFVETDEFIKYMDRIIEFAEIPNLTPQMIEAIINE